MWNEHLTNYLKNEFDVEKVTNGAVQWIREWFAENNGTAKGTAPSLVHSANGGKALLV